MGTDKWKWPTVHRQQWLEIKREAKWQLLTRGQSSQHTPRKKGKLEKAQRGNGKSAWNFIRPLHNQVTSVLISWVNNFRNAYGQARGVVHIISCISWRELWWAVLRRIWQDMDAASTARTPAQQSSTARKWATPGCTDLCRVGWQSGQRIYPQADPPIHQS